MNARPAACGGRGFSLVEVMIALAITGVIGALTAGAFRQIDRASEIARAQGERYAAARLALSRLSREVSMAYLSDHFDARRFRDRSQRPTLFKGREDTLLFTTQAHERLATDAKESDRSVVEYTLGPDPDHAGEEALLRRENARIEDDADREGRKDVVADHVSGFRVSYWDAKRKDWVREWSTRSVEHQDDLPSRVRFELDVKLADGRVEKFSTQTRIALTRPLDF